jgi:TPR repeat protein
MFDYLLEGLDQSRPSDLYAEMAVFVTRVYPEAEDQHKEVNSGLFAIASTLANRGAYAEAAKVFRAGAEFGNDGYAQYYLAVLYNSGAGLQENDLAALYWLDCAVDNGAAEMALVDRDGMLAAYRQSLSANEFQEMMAALADWCENGTPDVPVDPEKAARWRELA